MFVSLLFGFGFVTGAATMTNVAVGKPVRISAYLDGHNPTLAVDGSKDTRFCAYTYHPAKYHWLVVDLKGTFTMSYVNITIDEYDVSMNSFSIILYTQNPVTCHDAVKQICSEFPGSMRGPQTRAFECDTPIIGRFLSIYKWKYLNGNDALRLCEVEAFAVATDVCQYPRPFHRVARARLGSVGSLGSEPVSNVLECSFKCASNGTCLAFNYNKIAKMCELIWSPEKYKIFTNTSWDYYGDDFC